MTERMSAMWIPESKLMSFAEAFAHIKSATRIVTGMSPSEPVGFFQGIHQHVKGLDDIDVICANPSKAYPCFENNSELSGLKILVMFLTSRVRDQGLDRVYYLPQHLSQWVKNTLAEKPVDIFWGTCSPPDPRGFVSLGLNCCYESELFRSAKIKILEVNPDMPVTFGATSVAIKDVDGFIPVTGALPSIVPAIPGPIEYQIGEFVADLIEDSSTIQLGIGAIPNAIGKSLGDKRHLGVHTEMMNDTMMELFEKGVITNSAKTLWPGKIVACFVYGTQKLYKFVDSNPFVELQPASVLNDPYRIGKNHKMVSLNTAVEIDITGQVCSESVGHRELSGVGGASETHIGAQRSAGGRGVIALKSLSGQGASKIVFELQPGAKVSISRNDIDTVVTEYGVARLKGKSVRQRAELLISLASPEFRDELRAQAKSVGYI